jgi:hypothetical protein
MDQIDQKPSHKCQIYVIFVFLNVQVRILKKWTKIMRKRQKRAREFEKDKKPRPGKELTFWIISMLKLSRIVLGNILQEWQD